MYKEVLRNIDNVAIWPVISFVIFFLFFVMLLWWALTADRKFINYMRNMPMNEEQPKTETSEPQTQKL